KIEKRNFNFNLQKNEVEIENFDVNYDAFSKNFKISVYLNPNNIDVKFIKVYLKIRNNENEILKIPFKFLKIYDGKFVYELEINKNLIQYPLVKCKIIATSGLWNNEKEIFLIKNATND
ncbi:MAG: hypothetical protein ACK40Y_10820, partial [Cloacibacterium caeni]